MVGRAQLLTAVAFFTMIATLLASAHGAGAQSWRDFSPKERYDALQNYWRHEQLPQDRQQDVEKGYERWRDMSPEERARIRQNYERLQHLPPQERERFQRRYKKWKGEGGSDH